jgi:hypothetical protein
MELVSIGAGGGVVSSAGGVVSVVVSCFGAQEASANAATNAKPKEHAFRFINRVISLSFRGKGFFVIRLRMLDRSVSRGPKA